MSVEQVENPPIDIYLGIEYSFERDSISSNAIWIRLKLLINDWEPAKNEQATINHQSAQKWGWLAHSKVGKALCLGWLNESLPPPSVPQIEYLLAADNVKLSNSFHQFLESLILPVIINVLNNRPLKEVVSEEFYSFPLSQVLLGAVGFLVLFTAEF